MVISTVASGVFMWAVHTLSKVLPPGEYSVFSTMFQLLNWVTIPAIGLQMVFAQQAATALGDAQQRELASAARAVGKGVFGLWLVVAGLLAWRQQEIASTLQVMNPMALWLTLGCALTMLWLPILGGVLQGRQNFLWLGWSAIFSGVGRFASASFIVLVLGGWAAGIVTGALLGLLAALCVAAWQCRDLLTGAAPAFAWRGWLRRVVPLTLGFGAGQLLFSADQVFVQSNFDRTVTDPYSAAGTLARALVAFTLPLAGVMFSKIARSVATNEDTNVLTVTLGCTLALAGGAALGLTVLAPLVIKLGFNPKFVGIAPLLPWFAWAMVPLTLAQVLVNNLMARERFRVVPWLMLVAAAYLLTLWLRVPVLAKALEPLAAFRGVVEILGGFNLLLLAVAAVFTWKKPAA